MSKYILVHTEDAWYGQESPTQVRIEILEVAGRFTAHFYRAEEVSPKSPSAAGRSTIDVWAFDTSDHSISGGTLEEALEAARRESTRQYGPEQDA